MAGYTVGVTMEKNKQGFGLLIASYLSIFKVTNEINAVAIRKISVYSKPAKYFLITYETQPYFSCSNIQVSD